MCEKKRTNVEKNDKILFLNFKNVKETFVKSSTS